MTDMCVCGGSRAHPNPDCERCGLVTEVDHLRMLLATHERDLQDAAGELMIPIPEPGTSAAKLLSANALMRAERDAAVERYNYLLNVVIQPWTRDGDGTKLFKVNLAWFDTAATREEAVAMVERVIARVKREAEGGAP
jgi:hypothetical protein